MVVKQRAVPCLLAIVLLVAVCSTASAQVAAVAAGSNTEGRVSSAEISSSGGVDKRITINLQDTPIRTAVDMICREAGLNYAFEGDISGTVTVNISDTPFDQVMQIVLRSAGLTMRRENNTYMIGPRKEIQNVAETAGNLVEYDDTEIARESSLEKIPIDFADVMEIGAIFGSQFGGGGGMMGGYGGRMGGYGGGGMMGGYGGGMGGGSYGGYGGGGRMGGYGGYGGGGSYGGYGGGGGYGGYGGGGSYGGYGGGGYGGYGGGGSYGGYGGTSGGRRW